MRARVASESRYGKDSLSPAWRSASVYTLDGRLLQGEPTQKGIYVRNGKKVIIK